MVKPRFPDQPKEFEEKVIQVNRVSKKTKGGNQIGFSVVMVVGNKKGKIGVGLGKSPDVLSGIRKAARRAKKNLIQVPMKKSTIPHHVSVKFGAAKVLLRPAPPGSGIIAGGPIRAIMEVAGIKDISAKVLGTRNPASNVYAVIKALKKLQSFKSPNETKSVA